MIQLQRLSINGLSHHINFWGSSKKPKLFLFHGWMDLGSSFQFVCEKLSKHFYCIAPDWRGFGKSAHTSNPLGYFFYEYVADAHRLFQKLASNEKVRVVGHSMGGNILSFYAGTFPERFSHFVNIEGFGIHDMPAIQGPDKMRKWIDEIDESKNFKIYPSLKELAGRLIQTNPRLPMDKAIILARAMSRRVKGGYQIAADPRHKMANPYLFRLEHYMAFLKKIEAQCLLVAAEHTEMDEWMKPEGDIQQEIQKRMEWYPAPSQKVIIKNSGHMIHHEKPEELAEMILSFLV